MAGKSNILVTGGAGYIGSHACKVLSGAGYVPVTYDNLSLGHRDAVKYGPFVEGDLSDGERLRAVLSEYEVGAVVHFAANAYVGESVENPRKYFRNNVVNSLNLLEAMVDADVKHLVYSSTCAIYGMPDKVPIPEEHSQNPVSPYGESKRIVENMVRWFCEAYGLSCVALRYFNAAGADMDGDIGESHVPETHLIPIVIETALGKRTQMEIYGSDYSTRDGTAVRDYVHVTDLASAHLKALEYLIDGGSSDAFNLGTGQGRTVREIIQAVENVCGRTVPSKEGERRPGDAVELVADARRAKEILGWQPLFSELEQIVASAWKWHSKSD
ncbi:MAG: UDP-glucose 4-epimerase GalE [Nitrospinaceae bacterium]|nr:UDP-glucose 4-epimerase GalE [Nitrospinaceae bacterium]MBT3433197.1 UDP-glucose 4-epimerase GalE [Nitrospinaceae bacterium]MBT3822226.1 UDP-glucose 4-epimerase GalE [Nitrospinaceae bacterium]MBT4093906.1 UDP-glucose 4-epimerase GalE [Nitrospinaceae bacterium]MBT4431587.1 UDP-glucose 4-epimerase GalE [Nitrospinaceae bacterium]